MGPPIWFGSADGVHVVISDDLAKLPAGCTPAPVHSVPSESQIDALTEAGCDVEVSLSNEAFLDAVAGCDAW